MQDSRTLIPKSKSFSSPFISQYFIRYFFLILSSKSSLYLNKYALLVYECEFSAAPNVI